MRPLEGQRAAGPAFDQGADPLRLSFRGALDGLGAIGFESTLRNAEELVPESLLVDLSEVASVGPDALRALAGVANRAWCEGHEVRVIAPQPMRRLFALLEEQVHGLAVETAPTLAGTP